MEISNRITCVSYYLKKKNVLKFLFLKSNFLLCTLFFLSDNNFISNEENLIFNIDIIMKRIIKLKNRVKNVSFYLRFFQNTDLISQENPILADAENIIKKI